MGLTKKLRSLGLLAGIGLFAISFYDIYLFISDPPSQNAGEYLIMGAIYFGNGLLLLAPWSRLKSKMQYIALAILLILSMILLCFVIYATNMWALIHGAGLYGQILLAVVIIVGITQLLVLWSLSPKSEESA